MIDATSGGALVDKTPDEAKRLIANMAANSQQFGMRMDHTPMKVNEVSTSNLEKQISDLTSLVRQLAVGKMQIVKVCGICSGSGHAIDTCPALQEDESMQHVNAVGNYGQPQQMYDYFSNTYNPGWRDHPNLSYGNQPVQNRYQQQRPQVNQPLPPLPLSNQGMSLDEIVKALANNTQHFQQETRNSIQNIERQIGQLASSVSKLEAQGFGKLPSQTVMNPRENVSAILLRSGKEVDNQTPHESSKKKKQGEKESEVPKVEVNTEPKLNKVNNSIIPSFPCRLAKTKKEE
ncbi:hypothetical protein P3X46_024562 [Hevea brasiliensis]|uniref:Retrotransposon gag protein n=1 Tax=Hevea brasiliensis TaxID=3981 RepID=A0ABQ9L2V5_HEVBR|nr:hypothetical protein P3X46_024562 [Hevea brasiliensis]